MSNFLQRDELRLKSSLQFANQQNQKMHFEPVLYFLLTMGLTFTVGLSELDAWAITSPNMPSPKHPSQVSKSVNLTLQGLKKDGSISHKTNVVLKNVTLIGNVFAGQNLTVVDSEIHGNIKAGGSAHIKQSRILGSINIGKNLSLVQTYVSGSLSVRHLSDITGLVMPNGMLSTSHPSLKLIQSQVKNIRMAPRLTSHLYTKGHDGKTHSPHEGYVYLEPGSVLSAGGFYFQSTEETTSVRTPEGFIYQNGVLLKGKAAPANYPLYRQKHSKAPLVKGPGWPTQPRAGTLINDPLHKGRLLVLSKNTLVSGQILFDDGNGIVVLESGSKLTGTIEGGVIQP